MKEKTNMPAHAGDKVAFGFWVYLMSDGVLFAALFATFAVLRDATFGGPSAGDIFDLPFVLTETMLLLASSFTIGLALVAAHTHKKRVALALLTATLVLGLGFLAMELIEFIHLIGAGEGPARSAFLSSFFVLLGTHGLHVFLGSLWMVVMMMQVTVLGLTHSVNRRLLLLSLFWHFLDIIWIFIFTFVYLLGALAL